MVIHHHHSTNDDDGGRRDLLLNCIPHPMKKKTQIHHLNCDHFMHHPQVSYCDARYALNHRVHASGGDGHYHHGLQDDECDPSNHFGGGYAGRANVNNLSHGYLQCSAKCLLNVNHNFLHLNVHVTQHANFGDAL